VTPGQREKMFDRLAPLAILLALLAVAIEPRCQWLVQKTGGRGLIAT
jgi:hypothetical protein